MRRVASSVLTPHLELSGWLHKQGAKGLFRGWKKRWCRFKFGKLFYAVEAAEQPLGFIDVDNAADCRIASASAAAGFCFQIVTAGRTYELRAASLEELTYWTEGLNAYRELRRMNPLLDKANALEDEKTRLRGQVLELERKVRESASGEVGSEDSLLGELNGLRRQAKEAERMRAALEGMLEKRSDDHQREKLLWDEERSALVAAVNHAKSERRKAHSEELAAARSECDALRQQLASSQEQLREAMERHAEAAAKWEAQMLSMEQTVAEAAGAATRSDKAAEEARELAKLQCEELREHLADVEEEAEARVGRLEAVILDKERLNVKQAAQVLEAEQRLVVSDGRVKEALAKLEDVEKKGLDTSLELLRWKEEATRLTKVGAVLQGSITRAEDELASLREFSVPSSAHQPAAQGLRKSPKKQSPGGRSQQQQSEQQQAQLQHNAFLSRQLHVAETEHEAALSAKERTIAFLLQSVQQVSAQMREYRLAVLSNDTSFNWKEHIDSAEDLKKQLFFAKAIALKMDRASRGLTTNVDVQALWQRAEHAKVADFDTLLWLELESARKTETIPKRLEFPAD